MWFMLVPESSWLPSPITGSHTGAVTLTIKTREGKQHLSFFMLLIFFLSFLKRSDLPISAQASRSALVAIVCVAPRNHRQYPSFFRWVCNGRGSVARITAPGWERWRNVYGSPKETAVWCLEWRVCNPEPVSPVFDFLPPPNNTQASGDAYSLRLHPHLYAFHRWRRVPGSKATQPTPPLITHLRLRRRPPSRQTHKHPHIRTSSLLRMKKSPTWLVRILDTWSKIKNKIKTLEEGLRGIGSATPLWNKSCSLIEEQLSLWLSSTVNPGD